LADKPGYERKVEINYPETAAPPRHVTDKSLQSQIDYYDQRWQKTTYANLYCLERCIFFLEALLSLGIDQPRICDLGSGTGWLAGILSSFGPVVAVELSPEAVKLARSKYPDVQFIAGDATAWQPEPQSFDVVVSQEVIEHISAKADYLKVAHRALKPGGHLLITTPNLAVLESIPSEERSAIWEIQPVELPLRRASLTALLNAAGFDVRATSSVVDQQGKKGLHRLVNSSKLWVVLDRLNLLDAWRSALLRRDFGMYLTTKARAR
jgi:SAM-dependent methyltransferase